GELATLVDIGANRGQFALLARAVVPSAAIHSFEPLAGPAQTYRTVLGDEARVTLHQVAVGAEAGQHTIHISARDDSSSLLPIGDRQEEIFPGTHEVGTQTIDVAPLAHSLDAVALEAPALLKLDVQGFELEALKGCESLLERFEWVYCECSFVEMYLGQALAGEVIAWLQARGFLLASVGNLETDRHGVPVQADILLRRAA
ncbi:MAG: FkbM family methyltransferase, partial [Pseudomonadota bacterium]